MSGAVLPRQMLRALLAGDPPLVAGMPDPAQQLQPHGIDLTVRDIQRYTGAGGLGAGGDRAPAEMAPLDWGPDAALLLPPGPYLVTHNEVVHLPADVMALARPRSTLLRLGAALHTAVWDAGYHGRGQALLVVYNPAGLRLRRDARICQLVFFRLAAPTDRAYSGRYQGENL